MKHFGIASAFVVKQSV